jgi:hypothetical protein
MAFDIRKITELGSRVVNNKMLEDKATGVSDENDIREYCSKVFGDGSVSPDPSMLHQFNNVVVLNANEIAKPMATELLNLFADFKPSKPGDIYAYNVPEKTKAKVKWAANGTGADLVRIETGKKTVAIPKTFSTGFYYEPLAMVQDSVENYRNLVNDVANAKLRLYLTAANKVIAAAISSGKIPAKNVKTGADLTLTDFNKVASTIARLGYGGKPIFVADTLLIDYFAMQQTTDSIASKLLSDKTKDELLNALNITNIGRSTAVNLVNPFTDDTNSAVELPVNEGYFFSSAVSLKPLVVVEYGGLRQSTEQDPEDERIKMIIKQEAAIELVYGAAIGYVKETNTSKVGL